MNDEISIDEVTLYRTRGRGRLHVMGCSHLPSADPSDFVVADAKDRAELPVCGECEKEVMGSGRIEYPSLDAAFEALRLPVENRPRMREIAAGLEYEKVWTPQASSYVAAGFLDGRPVAAYFNKGFVDVRVGPKDYRREELPSYSVPSGGRGRSSADAPAPSICPTCTMQLPATGICDDCG